MIYSRKIAELIVPFALVLGGCSQKPGPKTASDAGVISNAEAEAVYLKRYEAQQNAAIAGGGLPAYDPLAKVGGAAKDNLQIATKTRIDVDALEAGKQFAAVRNSSAFIVYHDGKIASEAYLGPASKEGADYLVNAKSLAKPISAIMVGRAIQQGYIKSLDQPAADFLTEWKGDPKRSKILIRHLLDMRTGLAPQAQGKGPEDPMNRAYLHPRHDEEIIKNYPLMNEPGSRYEYANANSELVAPVIERATGRKYHDYLTEQLLLPMGARGGTIWMNRKGGTPHSGCCVQLPARTYLQFGILLLNDGVVGGKRLLPEGYVAKMRTATKENPHAGLGVWIAGPYVKGRGPLNPSVDVGKTLHSEPYADKGLFLFDGNGSQVVYIVPSQNLVIVRTGGRPPKDKPWDNSYIPNLIINAIERGPDDTVPVPQKRD